MQKGGGVTSATTSSAFTHECRPAFTLELGGMPLSSCKTHKRVTLLPFKSRLRSPGAERRRGMCTTAIEPAGEWYDAEEYHQQFLKKRSM